MSTPSSSDRRRSRGEGTYRQRPSGRWEVRVTLPDGKGTRRSFYVATRAEAIRLAGRYTGTPDAATPPASIGLTPFLEDWYAGRLPFIAERSASKYRYTIDRHITPYLGAMRVASIDAGTVRWWHGELLTAGVGKPTIHDAHAILSAALNSPAGRKILRANPAAEVTPPAHAAHRAQRAPSEAELDAILEAVTGDPLEALYLLAVTTGARQGELLALRWQDLELEAEFPVAHVSGNLDMHGARVERTKTAGSTRDLPIDAELLVPLLRELHKTRIAAGGGPYVFSRDGARPIDPSAVRRHFHELCAELKIGPYRWHDLRHGSATLLLKRGVAMPIVSRLLGHERQATTDKTYGHVKAEDARGAIAAIFRPIAR